MQAQMWPRQDMSMLQWGWGNTTLETLEQLGLQCSVALAGYDPASSCSPAHVEILLYRVSSSKIWPDFKNTDISFNLHGGYQKLFNASVDLWLEFQQLNGASTSHTCLRGSVRSSLLISKL